MKYNASQCILLGFCEVFVGEFINKDNSSGVLIELLLIGVI